MITRTIYTLVAWFPFFFDSVMMGQQPLQPKVSLSVTIMDARLSRNGVLRCSWKLKNNGNKIIHVYSSYLKASGEHLVRPKDEQTLLVLTTWLKEQKDTYPAYAFPTPEFIHLDPGAEASGALERHSVSARETGSRRKVSLVVGYVTDIEQFKEDLKESLKAGTEFQVNSIVRWQKVQYSVPITLIRY